jgi:hypothetical protein
MSEQAIEKIRDAEGRAELLCRVAQEKADEMRERVRAQGEEHLAEVEESTTEEFARELEDVRRRARLLEEKKRKEAQKEADELIARARERMAEAAHLIVWEIVEDVSL